MSDSITSMLNEGSTLKDLAYAIYEDMSDEFKERIPSSLLENPQDFGKALDSYVAGQNEWNYALINQLALININYHVFNNPLSMFKKGMLEYGDTIEDVYVEPIKALLYESEVPNDNPGDVWETFKPEVNVEFHKINKEFMYPLTLNRDMLRRAYRSYRELDKWLSAQMQAVYNGDNIDDFDLTMQLISNNYDYATKVHVDEVVDETTAKTLVKAVRTIVPTLAFPSRKYNKKGVLNWASANELYLLVTPSTQAILDVDVLANAFNMGKTEFMGHVVAVPYLPKGCQALLLDEKAMQIYDTLIEMASTERNARHLTTNFFYHHHGLFAISPYYTCVGFTTDTISNPTALTIEGVESITKKSRGVASATYTASLTATDTLETQGVEWSIVGDVQYASIDQNGQLSIGAKCSESTITIKATSIADTSISSTKEITIA